MFSDGAGDFLRFNSLYHGMVLEGGFDEEGNFVFIPFDDLDKMSEYFRRMIIKFFLDKKLIKQKIRPESISTATQWIFHQ